MSAPPLPSGLRDWKASNAPSSVRLTHEGLSSGPKGTESRDIMTDSCARAEKADEKRNSATENPGIFLRNGNIGLLLLSSDLSAGRLAIVSRELIQRNA